MVVLASKPLLPVSDLFQLYFASLRGFCLQIFTLKLSSPASLNVKGFLFGFTPCLQAHLCAFILFENMTGSQVPGLSILTAAVWNFSLTIFPLTDFQTAHTLAWDITCCPLPTPESQLPFLPIHSLYQYSSNVLPNHQEWWLKCLFLGPIPDLMNQNLGARAGDLYSNELSPEDSEVWELLLSAFSKDGSFITSIKAVAASGWGCTRG